MYLNYLWVVNGFFFFFFWLQTVFYGFPKAFLQNGICNYETDDLPPQAVDPSNHALTNKKGRNLIQANAHVFGTTVSLIKCTQTILKGGAIRAFS